MGPKPGEFAALVSGGLNNARQRLLNPPAIDIGSSRVDDPILTDLGPFPPQKSAAAVQFESSRRQQIEDLQLWWLDRMVASDHALTERMTWFWHGHWATALAKVQYALPMYQQNQLLRKTALANFKDQSRGMIVDSALLYWLDGSSNVVGAPNENLAREFMELFTLGVGAYTELDVQTIARALTGYSTVRSAGTVSFNSKKHDASLLSFLGTTGSFDAPAVSDYVTSLPTNQQFIARRIWYRFISSNAIFLDQSLATPFAQREILPLVQSLATSSAMSDPTNSQSKSPVDWFVSVCRATNVLPSTLPKKSNVIRFLETLGQVPFDPPNVGGWPADEAWINISSMQARLAFSRYILAHADLTALNALPVSDERLTYLADMFGVAQWSSRTKSVLRTALSNPLELLLISVNAPEYVVNL